MTTDPKVWLYKGSGVTWYEYGKRFEVHWPSGPGYLQELPEGAERMVALANRRVDRDEYGNLRDADNPNCYIGVSDDRVDASIARLTAELSGLYAAREFLEAEQAAEDAEDITVLEQRRANDNGVRHSLDDVLSEFGLDRQELAVTPESLEAHAEWMRKPHGISGWLVAAECLTKAAELLRVESESTEARKRVLADPPPGVHVLESSVSLSMVLVMPDGRFLWLSPETGIFEDKTRDYGSAVDRGIWRVHSRYGGDLSPVATE